MTRQWDRSDLKGGGTIRDCLLKHTWKSDLMGLGPTQGPGSGMLAEKWGVNRDFLKSGWGRGPDVGWGVGGGMARVVLRNQK